MDIRDLSVFHLLLDCWIDCMDETNSLIDQRKAKLAALRAKGINPFANKFTPTETCDHARSNYV